MRRPEPSRAGRGISEGDDLPANNVSWHDAVAFCNRLSRLEGLAQAYIIQEDGGVTRVPEAEGYRLPTEAEWEYACRAGTETAYSFGDDEAELGDFAWFRKNADDVRPVGRKKPNPWGLHDMHGNMYEWCWDSYSPYPYKGPIVTSPAGGVRVVRGGSFVRVARHLRSANRHGLSPEDRLGSIGFRGVRGPRRQR
jgi:formylglycine-generating enzyme